VSLCPAFKFRYSHEQASTHADYAEIIHNVALKMVATHAKGQRRLVDRQRYAGTWRD
jgi:hypothetical protein